MCMEKLCDDRMELPPGFRFHPTDEELITHYLYPKLYNVNFSAAAIGNIDLNKVEPWDLPWMAKMGEDEWYFFCVKEKKYPTGSRTNRATEAGYWKATGKDKEIHRSKKLIGIKKTLVFYQGRAPRGQKTNWIMHEFRLEGKNTINNISKNAMNEWAISRIFHKNSSGKKTHISGLVKMNEEMFESLNTRVLSSSTSSPKHPIQNSLFPPQSSLEFPDTFLMQDEFIFNYNLENNGAEIKQSSKTEYSHDTGGMSTDLSSEYSHETGKSCFEDQEYPFTSGGPLDLGCLWTY